MKFDFTSLTDSGDDGMALLADLYTTDSDATGVAYTADGKEDDTKFTDKKPPSYDGHKSYFLYETETWDWVDVTRAKPEKQSPLLKSNMLSKAKS